MENLSAAWLYPIILTAGVLQAWGPPMNNALKKALVDCNG
jgi:transporter family-2 protein